MKRLTLLFILFASLLVGCNGQEIPECGDTVFNTPHITIATAFWIETDAVKQQMLNQESCQFENSTYTVGKIGEQQVLLFETGVGSEKAIASTNRIVSNFEIEIIIFSGIAGGIEDSAIGTTFVPYKWFDLETGESVFVNESLLSLVTREQITGITSPEFVSDPEIVEFIRSNFQAIVVDMETYHVAKIASENNIPFIAFRSVSDHADGDKKRESYQQAANASAVQVIDFIWLYSNTSP
ncbi:MAG: 5'-methylthioadenosine/S-adenosylhomocysteine nucleosidase [Candidatus Pacebacteria bacterium]|jgi:adenosylhomocysteine nucleosidase|nr:5'-methylthioadenosine/S-adenosylhomocysteine nucleosidase [Candidatus Paceibacterota bacterium]MBT4652457.1 5'-methylthioadenosine/S-adenosylhomocysteine nucleosidase [Candidatus Paceibacterota bacterium]MBT6756284.1 5'-methylthioadenosine/S-adenosylhomocysteine nucleosidase [Candidatus Paceibacterota bacterium]MBT6921575.1 5'-methylthioadenosine/S-adenosylhomocysteine nucleosidase [Candidatus Paceibacterota bacterium]